jgi:hypothetical protein
METAVNNKLDGIISRHQQALRQTMRTYEDKMNQKMHEGKPQEAFNVWKDFPINLRTRESDQEIQQLLQRTLGAGFVPR